jgi:molybdenum cofactor cytidylyltransferase
MTAAVVLAAGMSTRMGTLKQLLPFGRSTVLGAVIENLQSAGLDRVIVVLGHEVDQVRRAVDGDRVECVVNKEYVVGMFSSVQAGLRALPADTRTILICLGDQPGIRGETIRALIAAFGECRKGVGIPFTANDQGHPLFVSGKYRNELLLMSPTLTLKHFLSAHASDIARLPIQDGSVLRDIDTPAEYEAERRHYSCDI